MMMLVSSSVSSVDSFSVCVMVIVSIMSLNSVMNECLLCIVVVM